MHLRYLCGGSWCTFLWREMMHLPVLVWRELMHSRYLYEESWCTHGTCVKGADALTLLVWRELMHLRHLCGGSWCTYGTCVEGDDALTVPVLVWRELMHIRYLRGGSWCTYRYLCEGSWCGTSGRTTGAPASRWSLWPKRRRSMRGTSGRSSPRTGRERPGSATW